MKIKCGLIVILPFLVFTHNVVMAQQAGDLIGNGVDVEQDQVLQKMKKDLQATQIIVDEIVSVTDKIDGTKFKIGDKFKFSDIKGTLLKLTTAAAAGSLVQLAIDLTLHFADFGPSQLDVIQDGIEDIKVNLNLVDARVKGLGEGIAANMFESLDDIAGTIDKLMDYWESAMIAGGVNGTSVEVDLFKENCNDAGVGWLALLHRLNRVYGDDLSFNRIEEYFKLANYDFAKTITLSFRVVSLSEQLTMVAGGCLAFENFANGESHLKDVKRSILDGISQTVDQLPYTALNEFFTIVAKRAVSTTSGDAAATALCNRAKVTVPFVNCVASTRPKNWMITGGHYYQWMRESWYDPSDALHSATSGLAVKGQEGGETTIYTLSSPDWSDSVWTKLFYIEDISVATSGNCPLGYHWQSAINLNSNNGGTPLYLCFKYAHWNLAHGNPEKLGVSDIKLTRFYTVWHDKTDDISDGYERIFTDLNEGAGGISTWIYLDKRRVSVASTDRLLVDVKTVSHSIKDNEWGNFVKLYPYGYEIIKEDVNVNSGGDYIYLYPRYADKPPAPTNAPVASFWF